MQAIAKAVALGENVALIASAGWTVVPRLHGRSGARGQTTKSDEEATTARNFRFGYMNKDFGLIL